MPAGAREVVPCPHKRSIALSTSAGHQMVSQWCVVGALKETVMSVIDGSLTPVTAAIRLVAKAEEVHVGSVVAGEKLGY